MKTTTIVIDNETVEVDGVIYRKTQDPETVSVAGLTWDVNNITDEFCNFYEANGRAVVSGKRLPTREEWEKLSECPSVWDEEKKGRWFADNECDLKNPYKSLFLPAVGHRYADGSVGNQGTYGYYWSSTADSGSNGYYLAFDNTCVYPSNYYNYANGFGVRCVRPE